jgi:hypothetical protein
MWQTKLRTRIGQRQSYSYAYFSPYIFGKPTGIQNTGLDDKWHSANWKMLHVSLETDTLHLLMYSLEQNEQGLTLCTVCSVCLSVCVCVSYQAVWWQHHPIRNTPAHTTWTRAFWIIHEEFRCFYESLMFNFIYNLGLWPTASSAVSSEVSHFVIS